MAEESKSYVVIFNDIIRGDTIAGWILVSGVSVEDEIIQRIKRWFHDNDTETVTIHGKSYRVGELLKCISFVDVIDPAHRDMLADMFSKVMDEYGVFGVFPVELVE